METTNLERVNLKTMDRKQKKVMKNPSVIEYKSVTRKRNKICGLMLSCGACAISGSCAGVK